MLLLLEHPKQNSKALYAKLLEDYKLGPKMASTSIDQSKIGTSMAKLYLSRALAQHE